jgi:hypothetical protein
MQNDFTTQAGQMFPSIEEAADWTRNYRKEHPQLEADGKKAKVLYATYFDNEFLMKFMAQEGCVGLRFYQGTDGQKDRHIIVVGVDENGHDILKQKDEKGVETGEDGLVGNWGHTCPDQCSPGELGS